MKLSSELALESSLESIWSILTQFSAYPDWNPWVIRLEGELKLMGNAQVTLAYPDGDRVSTEIEITGWVDQKYFSFAFRKGPSWWFQEEHVFRTRARDDGKVVFFNEAYITGLSLRFGRKSVGQRMGYQMDQMNAALKNRLTPLTRA